MQRWAELLRARGDRARERGATYVHLAAPEKLSVYLEYFPRPVPFPRGGASRRLAAFLEQEAEHEEARTVFVDVTDALIDAKAEGKLLYWKTDTHWTFAGAYAAYLKLCERIGARPNTAILSRGFNHGDLVLDLGSKVSPPISEAYETHHVLHDAYRDGANQLVVYKEENGFEGVGGLHQGSAVVYRNPNPDADPRKLVLFGDSFSEYRPHLLTGILAETFSEVHFVWSAQVDWSYVDHVGPDVLVTQLAERFMNNVPEDDLNLEDFVTARIEAHRKESAQ